MTDRLTAHSTNSEILQILLQTMNGRMYDPVIGRVLSPDKVIQAPGYTQSYNRYSYCMNNPLRYTDPSGWQLQALDHDALISGDPFINEDINMFGTRDMVMGFLLEGVVIF